MKRFLAIAVLGLIATLELRAQQHLAVPVITVPDGIVSTAAFPTASDGAAMGQGVVGLIPTPLALYNWDSTGTQWHKVPNSYALFPSQNTPQAVAFYGWNAGLGQWTPCTEGGSDCFGGGPTPPASCPLLATDSSGNFYCVAAGENLFFTSGGTVLNATGGGGGCGPVQGDNTSTDCGYQNRVGDTATIPATDQTYGYTNLTGNAGGFVVAAGNQNGLYLDSASSDVVLVGDQNVQGSLGHACNASDVTAIGLFNGWYCEGASIFDSVLIGGSNSQFVASANTVSQLHATAIGSDNFSAIPANAYYQYNIAIGQGNLENLGGTDLVSGSSFNIGIGAFAMDRASDTPGGEEFYYNVAIGNTVASNMNDLSTENVAIGDNALSVQTNTSTGPTSYSIGIGSEAARDSIGMDVVALGDEVLGGLNIGGGTTFPNVGHDIVAIGNHSLAANTTGADNIGIGDFAGCIGCVDGLGGSAGNANKTGSHNVWIGDMAGPNTTSQLSNTIAIGYQAYNTASNQIVLGNSSITQATVYGTPQFPALLSAPCVGTDGSGKLVNNPGCTGGGSFTYPAGTGVVQVTSGSAWGTTLALQGTDSKIMTAGTVSGTSVLLCTDANGGATTASCPSGGIGYPGAGVAISTGSAWGASLTAPSSALVGISDMQTLTNKSIAGSEINSGTVAGTFLAPINLASSSNGGVTGQLPLTQLANQAANTVLANATGSSATPAAFAMPNCSGTINALTWVSGSGFACNSITAGNLPGGTLGSVPYQSSAGATAMLAPLTANGTYIEAEVVTASAAVAPSWVNLATYLTAPPAIGGTTPAAGTFTTLTVNGSGPNTVTFTAQTYAFLTGTYTCAGGIEGMMASLTDANTATWGATVSSGGGSTHVLVRCNGTNWTVVGI